MRFIMASLERLKPPVNQGFNGAAGAASLQNRIEQYQRNYPAIVWWGLWTGQSPVTTRYKLQHTDQLLWKFIHHPIILSTLDQGYFRKFAGDVGTSTRDQD